MTTARRLLGRGARLLLLAGLLGVLSACVAGLGLWLLVVSRPYPTGCLDQAFPESRRVLDRHGHLLREVVDADGARARWTPLEQLSPLAVQATVAVEDARFWQHRGIDWRGVARAAAQNLASARVVSGASTITMQLARLLGHYPRSLGGKLLQSVYALRLERAVGKESILEQYLNRAPYGGGTVGLEAASRRVFGKPSLHLSLAEAALLAGLPQSPSRLDPLRHPEAARRRQVTVLGRLFATGAIAASEHRRALDEQLSYVHRRRRPLAMHFTDLVLSRHPPAGEVRTTLDRDLQGQVERMVAEHVRSMAQGGLTNAAAIVLDNADCGVLAWVGSAHYWDGADGAVNGALALRQPGSALKPFTYALAFEQGFEPASVIADIPTEYVGADGALYEPRNYAQGHSGPVLLAEALGRSLNVPAIRLANEVGVGALLDRLHAAGFVSLDRTAGHYGLGLTLGNGEVTLLELAQAYAMLANGGLWWPARVLSDAPSAEPRRVFSPEAAFLVTDILSDEDLRVRAFGAATPLLLGFPAAVKTGTSSNWRDSWAVAYTPRHTVAVWAGDFGGGVMDRLSGAVGAGPLLHGVATLVEERGPVGLLPAEPEPPPGVEQVVVCSLSGMLPTAFCPHRRPVYLLRSDEPREESTWHRRLRLDRRNGLLASDRCPSAAVSEQVFERLPPHYARWQAEHGARRPPTRYSPLCPAQGLTADALVVTSPRRGDTFLIEPGYDRSTQTLRLSGEVDPALPEVTWLVDGVKVASVGWPYEASWPLARGHHRVEMVGGGRRSDPVDMVVR